jgi:hypothetical protein
MCCCSPDGCKPNNAEVIELLNIFTCFVILPHNTKEVLKAVDSTVNWTNLFAFVN